MVVCGDRTYNSFEELGRAILESLPKNKQSVKWWRIHKPILWHYESHLKAGVLERILRVLPHFSYSRSWVGYVWTHVYLLNKYDLMFTFGHWESEAG